MYISSERFASNLINAITEQKTTMNKTKLKIDYNRIAGVKPGEKSNIEGFTALHQVSKDTTDIAIGELLQQSSNNQIKKDNVPGGNKRRNIETERASGQRAFAKLKSARPHYITKK